MKKILIFLALVIGLAACHNQDWNFPDFDYTTGYFPYQYPVRTIVLGDYIFDNAADNAHQFTISAAVGGMYENTRDRVFNFQLAPELCNNVLFGSGKPAIKLMPASYYTLSSSSEIVVPKGEVNGGVTVQLTDAFFADPLSVANTYVIPLKLISGDVDSILQGKSVKANPDPRKSTAGEWDVLPKNFTMFCVKYINQYHGKYLHRGVNTVMNGGTTLETNRYHKPYNVQDEIWSLETTGLNTVKLTASTHSASLSQPLKMDLTFSADGACTIKESTGSAYTITGSGTFKNDAESWGDKLRDVIYLNYQFTSGGSTFSAIDTMVVRDRAVVMEVYAPVVN